MDRKLPAISLRHRWLRDQRGAALIHVGIAIFVLVGMSAFVLDFGVMWLARRQAQNAADAGALAGAIARAYDETDDPPADDGLAYQSAVAAAQANLVFNEVGGVRVTWDCPPYASAGRCVRVDVHRDGTDADGDGTTDNNSLPVYFASLFGLSGQRVRATATAWVTNGTTTNCMRPFGVIDNWDDVVDNTLTPPRFQRWEKVGADAVELDPKDRYVPAVGELSDPTGYTVEQHLGAQVYLAVGNNPNSAMGAVSPGWSLPLQLPDGAGGYESGANEVNNAIKNCIGKPVSIGDYLPTETGVMVGPIRQGVSTDSDSLINQDPMAKWDTGTMSVVDTCAPVCAPFSPRIVPVAVFDMDEYQWRTTENDWTTPWIPGDGPGTGTFSCPIGGRCVRVTNIIGFFVEGMVGQDVIGRVVLYPGDVVTGGEVVDPGSGFLQTIQLIR